MALRKIGAGTRTAASVVGMMSALLGLMTIASPPTDPSVLYAEMSVLLVLGFALAVRARQLRKVSFEALESGSRILVQGTVHRLFDGTSVVDFGDASIRPEGKRKTFGRIPLPDGYKLEVAYAGPSSDSSPRVIVFPSVSLGTAKPTLCSWVRTG